MALALYRDGAVDPSVSFVSNFYLDYPVNWAAEFGHAELLALLLGDARVSPNPSRRGHEGSSRSMPAIHRAARNGHVECVRLLITDGRSDVNDRNGFDGTPLYYASVYVHSEVVDLLLGFPGIDVNAIKQSIHNAAGMPSRNCLGIPFAAFPDGYAEIVRLLLATGKIDEAARLRAITEARDSNNLAALELLQAYIPLL